MCVCFPPSGSESPSRSLWLQEFLPEFQAFNLSLSFIFSCICTLALHWLTAVKSLSCDQRALQPKALHVFITTTTEDLNKNKRRFKGTTLLHYHNHSRLEYPRGTAKFITTYHTGRSLPRNMRRSHPSLSRTLFCSSPPPPLAVSLSLSPLPPSLFPCLSPAPALSAPLPPFPLESKRAHRNLGL